MACIERFDVYPPSQWVMTHFAPGKGPACETNTRNGMPCQSLSSVVQPVTQCMSACTVCGPSAFSSAYVNLSGRSTRPHTFKSHSASLNRGMGP